MNLAKPRVDIGLATNDIAPMLAFWQGEAGIPFDHLLKVRRGHDQHVGVFDDVYAPRKSQQR